MAKNNQGESGNKFEINFLFSKTGSLRYISHLDLMRLFTRAFRRANLPLYLTKGYNPHVKLSLKRALKLGWESEEEEASIVLTRKIAPERFKKILNNNLPNGVRILKVI